LIAWQRLTGGAARWKPSSRSPPPSSGSGCSATWPRAWAGSRTKRRGGWPASYSILLAAQPTGVNVYLIAARYAAAKDLATTTVSLSTAFSLLSVSVVVYLLHAMG
jgi:hypothetical protein